VVTAAALGDASCWVALLTWTRGIAQDWAPTFAVSVFAGAYENTVASISVILAGATSKRVGRGESDTWTRDAEGGAGTRFGLGEGGAGARAERDDTGLMPRSAEGDTLSESRIITPWSAEGNTLSEERRKSSASAAFMGAMAVTIISATRSTTCSKVGVEGAEGPVVCFVAPRTASAKDTERDVASGRQSDWEVSRRADGERLVPWRGGRWRSGCVGHAFATCPGEPQPKQTPPHLGQLRARWPGR